MVEKDDKKKAGGRLKWLRVNLRKELYVIAAAGETMQMMNHPDFKPKVW